LLFQLNRITSGFVEQLATLVNRCMLDHHVATWFSSYVRSLF